LQHTFRKGLHAPVRGIFLGPTRENRMGFMDKAKKLAEQAQEKLDEAQKNFNKPDSPQAPAGGVRYDEHGRPIEQEETPAAATAPPTAEPPAAGEPPAASEPSAGDSDANASPDPFKPIQ
jgi:hypothetical protein